MFLFHSLWLIEHFIWLIKLKMNAVPTLMFFSFQNLYDLLMSMLAERGVDRALAQKVVEFSTTYEHKQYIDFLATLKSFTTST